jgi:pSer/pThr/pTyr-binding forkhead associated (FHA) protein
MKLLFPNGEHGPVELPDGVTRVGSAATADITLVAPGIAAQHCEIDHRGASATIRIADPRNVVVVNGKQANAAAAIKPGDLVLFAKIGARVVAVDKPVAAARKDDEENDGRTRVRMALPRYVLRGVSGTTFGKTFPLFGTLTVGRHTDCDISIPGEEISRHHAKLQVMPEGISVEDLGSANGTFINGKRVHQGMLKPGEELRLDTVRFLLAAPGLEAQAPAKPAPAKAAAAKSAPAKSAPTAQPVAQRSGEGFKWFVLALLLLGAVGGGALWYFGYLPL